MSRKEKEENTEKFLFFRVDVLDRYGTYILRITTSFRVNNIQFAGPDLKQLWLTGNGAVARVEWELQGSLHQ